MRGSGVRFSPPAPNEIKGLRPTGAGLFSCLLQLVQQLSMHASGCAERCGYRRDSNQGGQPIDLPVDPRPIREDGLCIPSEAEAIEVLGLGMFEARSILVLEVRVVHDCAERDGAGAGARPRLSAALHESGHRNAAAPAGSCRHPLAVAGQTCLQGFGSAGGRGCGRTCEDYSSPMRAAKSALAQATKASTCAARCRRCG